jgi:hypothetical protein
LTLRKLAGHRIHVDVPFYHTWGTEPVGQLILDGAGHLRWEVPKIVGCERRRVLGTLRDVTLDTS